MTLSFRIFSPEKDSSPSDSTVNTEAKLRYLLFIWISTKEKDIRRKEEIEGFFFVKAFDFVDFCIMWHLGGFGSMENTPTVYGSDLP